MKKLLSIVIFVLFGVMGVWAANGTATIHAYAVYFDGEKYVQGGGKVQASAQKRKSIEWSGVEVETDDEGFVSTATGNGYDGYKEINDKGYWIRVEMKGCNTNYLFKGWYSGTLSGVDMTTPLQSVSGNVNRWQKDYSATTNGGDVYVYAVFEEVITPLQKLYEWILPAVAEPTITIKLNAAGALNTPQVQNTSNTNGMISATYINATTSQVTLKLTKGENVKDNDTYDITITSENNGSTVIKVSIVSYITVTLLPPTVEGCSIKAVPTIGGEENVTYYGGNPVKIKLEDPNLFHQKLSAIASSEYEFLRWKINGVHVSKQNPYEYTLKNNDEITAEFVPKGTALFSVMKYSGSTTTKTGNEYFSLVEAIDATNSEYNIVVVEKSGIIYTGDFETVSEKLDDSDKPQITKQISIPAGITLLIPGDGYPTQHRIIPHKDDLAYVTTAPSCRMHLTLPSQARINVNGNIIVYSKISNHNNHNGKPIAYGELIMDDYSEIVLNNGAILTALGYITGDPSKSSVLAKNGSKVYESFQPRDWRGGDATLSMIDNSARVFPMSQFFIQNIETKLTLQSGAEEYVFTGVQTAQILGMGGTMDLSMLFVGKSTGADNDRGLFCLSSGAELSKWYDGVNDKQMYEFEGVSSTESENKAHVGVMYTELSGQKLNSSNYVMPIPNNMEISFINIDMSIPYECALLPGASIYIDQNSSVEIKSSLYVYDKEHIYNSKNNGGYFSSSREKMMNILYTAYHDAAPTKRTWQTTEDASVVVDGQFIVTNGNIKDGNKKTLGAGFYTTAYSNSETFPGLSNVDADYGANITSRSGGGEVIFNTLATKTGDNAFTYQQQFVTDGGENVAIPITNARLRNKVGYSAGENAILGTYTYNEPTETWILLNPTEIDIVNVDKNDFLLNLPNPKTQNIICKVTGANVNVENFAFMMLSNDETDKRFTLDESMVSYQVSTDGSSSGTLSIPITYTPKGIHNLNEFDSQKLVVNWISGGEEKSLEIPLTATEDYTPDFEVKFIDANAVEYKVLTDKKYEFPMTTAMDKTNAKVVITPLSNTTASLLTEAKSWNCTAASEPIYSAKLGEGAEFLSAAQVTYFPQEKGGPHNGTLTITATYVDAADKQIVTSKSINLIGNAKFQVNGLQFKPGYDNYTIYQGGVLEEIFADLGTGLKPDFTITYSGGELEGKPATELVEIEFDEESKNYNLKVVEVGSITDVRKVKIVASQSATNVMEDASDDITITVLPAAIWNWSDLYFGSQITNPIEILGDDSWTLEEKRDENDLISSLEGDYTNYHTSVGTIYDENGEVSDAEYYATFTFKQGDKIEKDFTSRIYRDPRILPYHVDLNRKYRGVTTSASGISFDDATNSINFTPTGVWEIQMIGVPDKMTFSVQGDNTWQISQSDDVYNPENKTTNWTTIVTGKMAGEQEVQLAPTTRQVRIVQYGNNQDGKIIDLRISKLELSSDQDVLYFPINKDNTVSEKVLKFAHTNASVQFDIENNPGFTITPSAPIQQPTPDGAMFYLTTVTIKDGGDDDENRVEKGQYVLLATQGDSEISVPIYADYFPQGLPIRLDDDDEKRYYFIVTQSNSVMWDAANRTINFQTPQSSGSSIRSVTFAFEGAPSRLSFTTNQLEGWTIKESSNGERFNDCYDYSINGNDHIYQLKYTTRFVRIDYYSENINAVSISDLVIEGDPMLLVNPEELEFSDEEGEKEQTLTLTTINLNKIKVVLDNVNDFEITHAKAQNESNEYLLTTEQYPDALGINKVGDIVINTKWVSSSLANDGLITIYNILEDNSEVVLAKVKLVAAGKYIRLDNAAQTGIYTGIPDGTRDLDGDGNPDTEYKYTYHGKDYNENNASPYTYHEVNLTNAFAPDGTALFDYLFVYGETTTKEGQGTDITAPKGESGSNARTPYYVYARATDVDGNYDRYRFVQMVDDANKGNKELIPNIVVSSNETSLDGNTEAVLDPVEVKYIEVGDELSVYITGFAPYATTGYTKGDEGVWFFRGQAGSKLHVYLEDAHIFARNKMENGQPFYDRGHADNPTFTEGYARGSGGVLVFECVTSTEQIDLAKSFEVSIHTIGNNLLKSNYGCFNYFFGMDPFQISAPIHVRLHSKKHVRTSKTTLNFDDIWPTKLDDKGQITESKRTNGFLGLKKLNNNAPSIDLGNPYTTVNFNGGQVQLQNAQIVSPNYKTTLAISYRSGEYGGDKVGFKFAYGIGTDSVGGTVNFNDGTITIEPMWVKEEYKNYYFIDKDENGKEIKKKVGTIKDENDPTKKIDIYEYQTTCLRCPKNTYVYGGSICWLRACQHVTSKGGAPMGGNGIDVGQFIYTFDPETDDLDENTKLLKINSENFPSTITNGDGILLSTYFGTYYHINPLTNKREYGMNSITPDADRKLYFWIPEGYGGVSAEKDKFLTPWKACMTQISAGMQGITGTVGGTTPVEKNEEIKYMLYCQIDQNISEVITSSSGSGENKQYNYWAPVKVPGVAQTYYGSAYTQINPTSVGKELQNQVVSEKSYEVTDKVFYITTATADVWQTFTAPFDVAKIWVVETYSEAELEKLAKTAKEAGKNARDEVMLAQAKHNADFAAFFGVAMAIGTSEPLETIFNDFREWGEIQDKKDTDEHDNPKTPLYNGSGEYTLRDRYQLVPYNGSNWNKANFYLNHNAADWEIDGKHENGDPKFKVHWDLPDVNEDGIPNNEDGILMRKGETYSMLFPYCTGCWETETDEDGNVTVQDREFWDYWSGKFLIFESVDYSKESDKVHIIEGSDYIKEDWTADELETIKPDGIFVTNLPAEGKAKVTGNSTFAYLDTEREDILTYFPLAAAEAFLLGSGETIYPTSSFLLAPSIPLSMHNMPARGVKRTGEIIYDQPDDDTNGNQNGTTGHIPTVGGGNDLFITSIAGGINVAVAAPQNVRVLSSTGAVIYSGYVTTAVDVQLPTTGIYIVSGENEVQKILF